MEWEKSYLEALIDRLQPKGAVLEVGFALGYSSRHIQTYRPSHHTLIESDPESAKNAKKWAENNSAIEILEGTWDLILPQLGKFDAIFFNDFEPSLEAEKREGTQVANLVLQKGNDLIQAIQKQLPQLGVLRYTHSDLDAFFHQVGRFDASQMAHFLQELRRCGQISEEQYETILHEKGLERKKASGCRSFEKRGDCLSSFIEICLKNHMVKGSRLSWFATSPVSKYESPEFFESIITHPHLDYQESEIDVEVPASCKYYPYDKALVMCLEKLF